MKISKNTLSLLKNFANINGSLMLQEGNKLQTFSVDESIYAEAIVEEEFPSKFGIYDLSEFLSVLSLFKDPELTFNETYVSIANDTNTSTIKFYAAGEGIVDDNTFEPELPDFDISFNLSQEQLQTILKASNILHTENIRIVGDGTNLKIEASDKRDSTSNEYTQIIGTTEHRFKINISISDLKIMPGSYEILLSKDGISKFVHDELNLVYIIAADCDSNFN